MQKTGNAITVKHDVTAGVTNAVTESVSATPAVSADHWVTAGVTSALPTLLHVSHSFGGKVAENAGDICHAGRLRLNQSLMVTTAEMRLRAKLGVSQLGRSRPLWGLGAARFLSGKILEQQSA